MRMTDAETIADFEKQYRRTHRDLACCKNRVAILEETIRDTIESLERNSTSAPVVECLKAALFSQHQSTTGD